MRIERLELKNFRSYTRRTIHLGELTVLIGRNGIGKTNIVEAISLLSTGNSLRAKRTEEMINWKAEISQVTGIVEDEGEYVSLAVVLTPGVYLGKRTSKRRYLVDGAGRNKSNFVGRLLSVVFRPEDLRLIEGSPGRRRNYLDEILIQADVNYGRALTAYERALRRRNKVLDQIREERAGREQLAYWDQAVIKNGNIVSDGRAELVEYLSQVKTSYGEYRVEYQASEISEARLEQYKYQEVAAGHTLVGPHKDDIVVFGRKEEREQDLHKYGSRGEQRLGVLFLKTAGMRYIEKRLSKRVVLLLDDIFSELDQEHRDEVKEMMRGRQVIVTSAEETVIEGAKLIRLEEEEDE